MGLFVFFIVTYVLLSLSLYKIFEKTNIEPWKALVPGLNFVEWCTLIGRPKWWAALLLLPIVNFFIYAGMCVDMMRSFGKYGFWDSFIAVVFAPFPFFKLGTGEDKYLGPALKAEEEFKQKLMQAHESGDNYAIKKLQHNNPYKKSAGREWAEAIIFAVFAAAFIRMFLIEAYVIPTSSMEGSLLVGDFLFVSKMHYGIRTPMTTAMVPLLHNRLPVVDQESYLKSPALPYFRLPSITDIKRNDPVVFNFPEGDSVYVCPGRTWSVNDFRYRKNGMNAKHFRMIKGGKIPLTTRPIDKKDHYIKRCVGIAGDSLEIRDHQVYINGKIAENPSNMQFLYTVNSPNGPLNEKKLQNMGVNMYESNNNQGIYFLNKEHVEKIKGMGDNIAVQYYPMRPPQPNHMFPQDSKNFPGWTVDDFGPIYIPKKGATVEISPQNIALYRRVIQHYEGNKLEVKSGRIVINDEVVKNYTFKQNYYWMMGDNRHNSEDSRVWGFVPEDHIVGKPLFIWFSTKNASIANGINWSRIFTTANKM